MILEFPRVSGERRKTMLADPVAAIGAAYLQSRSVKAALLDPRVHVDSYPEGRFGSWLQDGVLVTERVEITGESEIRQVFALLVEAIEGPDETFDYLGEEPSSGTSLADYRRNTGFVPEVTFEFVGATSLRAELSLKQGRLLLQAGDRWEVYALDRWSGAALKQLLSAPRAVPGAEF
jgi:hypothetical protein